MSSPRYSFFFLSYGDHRDLHSFPTRRSSDLPSIQHRQHNWFRSLCHSASEYMDLLDESLRFRHDIHWSVFRSEEHTSELQSHSDLVCRLLLEKKKDKKMQQYKSEEKATHTVL